MGNYRQHMTFASVVGVVYALGVSTLAGVHWVYGTVAALLTTLGGLLPDLDHPVGTQLKGFTGILGVLAAMAVWHRVARSIPDMPFELHMWMAVLAYIFVRHGLRRTLAKMMVHRGISHSFPTCAVWGAAAFLYYPADSTIVRLLMASAVTLGFLSHLLLDEMFSVELSGARVKRSFGTAMKFWAPSLPATMAMYLLLSLLAYRVVEDWPDRTLAQVLAESPPPLRVPWDEIQALRVEVKAKISEAIPPPNRPAAKSKVNADDLPRKAANAARPTRAAAARVARRERPGAKP